jgi:hypothetical protein
LIPMRVTITARYHAAPDLAVHGSTEPAEIAREDLELVVGAADRWGTLDLGDLVDALSLCGDLDDVAVVITPTIPLPVGHPAGPACAWLSTGATTRLLGILETIASGGRPNGGQGNPRALATEALVLLGAGAEGDPAGRSQP